MTGSDLRDGPSVARLRELGVDVAVGHDRILVGSAQVVVMSSAIRADNPEIVEARSRKIPVIGRAEMLAEMMRLQDGIAIAGSHGKTTTTSMIAHVLDVAGLDPTAVIGGRVMGHGDRSGARLGHGGLLVAEADESDGSFLRLAPVISVITNIDPEHLDHYGTFDRLRDAFVEFAGRVPFWGVAVLCIDHPGVQAILPRISRRYVTYGFSSQADWVASDVSVAGRGMRFTVHERERRLGEVTLPVPGRHNVLNALAALAVASELDVDLPGGRRGPRRFRRGRSSLRAQGRGGRRRRSSTTTPTIPPRSARPWRRRAASIRAASTAIFQPHRYTRTRDCLGRIRSPRSTTPIADRVATSMPPATIRSPGIDGAACSATRIRAHGHRDVRFIGGDRRRGRSPRRANSRRRSRPDPRRRRHPRPRPVAAAIGCAAGALDDRRRRPRRALDPRFGEARRVRRPAVPPHVAPHRRPGRRPRHAGRSRRARAICSPSAPSTRSRHTCSARASTCWSATAGSTASWSACKKLPRIERRRRDRGLGRGRRIACDDHALLHRARTLRPRVRRRHPGHPRRLDRDERRHRRARDRRTSSARSSC